MAITHCKRTYRKHKLHWLRFTLRPTAWNWSLCGKRLGSGFFATRIEDVTCRTCLLILDIPPKGLNG